MGGKGCGQQAGGDDGKVLENGIHDGMEWVSDAQSHDGKVLVIQDV